MKNKRYHVTHKVRPYGAIGIFVSAARVIHAANEQEAIDQAREQWHAADHETKNGSAVLTVVSKQVGAAMHIADAMEIVLNLAKLSVAHFPNVPDPEQKEARQALALVEDFVVNHLGDDGDETEEDVGVHVFKASSFMDNCKLCGYDYTHPSHG